jgi:putative LysE/RhtB family amino acid efflux pump
VSDLTLLGRTFLIGIAVAAPVGAMGVLCIQRTLAGGWRAGFATGLGIATADAFYAGCAAFGVAALSTWLVALQTPLRLVGGAFLVYLGVRSAITATSASAGAAAAEGEAPPPAASLYASAVALTLTNPMTIMAFGAVFASAGLVAEPSLASAAIATAGVALGSLTWWLGLVTIVAAIRHGVSERALVWVSRISGAVVAGFGVLAIASAF